jgi:hypothetical protein
MLIFHHLLLKVVEMPQEYERSSIGATSGSQPIPSPQPTQAYQPPHTTELYQKSQESNRRIQQLSNKIDLQRMQINYLEEMTRVILESTQKLIDTEGYNAPDILKRYMNHLNDSVKLYRKQQELDDKNRLR